MQEIRISHEDDIATVELCREGRRNAFTGTMREMLASALEHLVEDDCTRAIILTGAAGHFSGGGDLSELARASQTDVQALLRNAHRCVRAIKRSRKPVVAAAEGYAVGGAAGLALACDALVMAESASLLFPFVKLGLVPDWGSLYLLRAKVGTGVASRVLLGGEKLNAARALQLGVADAIVGDGNALMEAKRLVQQWLRLPPEAWSITKAMLAKPYGSLSEALDDECERQLERVASIEFRAALNAALARAPS